MQIVPPTDREIETAIASAPYADQILRLPHRGVSEPRRTGRGRRVAALAAGVDADVAVALDPDADRCAIGIPTSSR